MYSAEMSWGSTPLARRNLYRWGLVHLIFAFQSDEDERVNTNNNNLPKSRTNKFTLFSCETWSFDLHYDDCLFVIPQRFKFPDSMSSRFSALDPLSRLCQVVKPSSIHSGVARELYGWSIRWSVPNSKEWDHLGIRNWRMHIVIMCCCLLGCASAYL